MPCTGDTHVTAAMTMTEHRATSEAADSQQRRRPSKGRAAHNAGARRVIRRDAVLGKRWGRREILVSDRSPQISAASDWLGAASGGSGSVAAAGRAQAFAALNRFQLGFASCCGPYKISQHWAQALLTTSPSPTHPPPHNTDRFSLHLALFLISCRLRR